VRSKANTHKPAVVVNSPSRQQYRDVLLKILDILPSLSGKFCLFCKVHRSLPLNAHRQDCAWRLGWELIDSDDT
jgi:hypothetical protein